MPHRTNKFINREISWLHFNERVLQEAADPKNPLIERIKFLGIYSNNMDEFFRVRVATLNRLSDFDEDRVHENIDNPKAILNKIYQIDKRLQIRFTQIYQHLLKGLEHENIYLINEKQLTVEQGHIVKKYFRETVRPNLFPVMFDQMQHTDFLKDKSIYLIIHLQNTEKHIKDGFALVKIPTTNCSRFFILPETNGKKYIIILDDVIRYCMDEIFKVLDYNKFDAYTIKFTRDAELDIDNDVSKSFMELISESLEQRKLGQPVRFIYDETIPPDMLKFITKRLMITKKDKLNSSGRYHNHKDFMGFPNVGTPKLEHEKQPPLPHKDLYNVSSIFDVVSSKDVLMHFPYQSYQHVIDWLREASMDPKVKSIKITIYRLARNSGVINALISAARNGKVVTAYMELQARFDEKANIYWSEKLQDEGVRIIHGIQGLKVHSKLLLIKRKETRKTDKLYAYIGTGNFNEETARVYADNALLTADEKITQEVDKVFGLFENHYKPVRFQKLIVSPFSQRKFFINLINREIANVKSGFKGKIIIKLNNLVDETIVRKLYQASQAGVEIKLIIRGICVLVPGIKGLSENIEAISIVDRYLEHSRIIYFYNNGKDEYYITSADWMIRNFDNRIEVGCPITSPKLKTELKKMLEIQLNDNTKARILSEKEMNSYKADNGKNKKVRAQVDFYHYLRTQFEKGENK